MTRFRPQHIRLLQWNWRRSEVPSREEFRRHDESSLQSVDQAGWTSYPVAKRCPKITLGRGILPGKDSHDRWVLATSCCLWILSLFPASQAVARGRARRCRTLSHRSACSIQRREHRLLRWRWRQWGSWGRHSRWDWPESRLNTEWRSHQESTLRCSVHSAIEPKRNKQGK